MNMADSTLESEATLAPCPHDGEVRTVNPFGTVDSCAFCGPLDPNGYLLDLGMAA